MKNLRNTILKNKETLSHRHVSRNNNHNYKRRNKNSFNYGHFLPITAALSFAVFQFYNLKTNKITYSEEANDNNIVYYTLDEIKKHNSKKNRVWVTYMDEVFDITG